MIDQVKGLDSIEASSVLERVDLLAVKLGMVVEQGLDGSRAHVDAEQVLGLEPETLPDRQLAASRAPDVKDLGCGLVKTYI